MNPKRKTPRHIVIKLTKLKVSSAAMNIKSESESHSVMSDSVTSWTTAHQASLSFTISWSLIKLMSIESVMPFNHLILYRQIDRYRLDK